MKAALAISPLAATVEATQMMFQFYKSGIFTYADCGTTNDHSVNVVGWGKEDNIEYWIMRNSWSTSWGEQGYMRLQIVDGPGLCGIQQDLLWAEEAAHGPL